MRGRTVETQGVLECLASGGMDRPGLDRMCEAFEAPLPSPAGGSAAAASAAIAASLVVMVGRGSPQWPAGLDASEEAVALRARLLDAATEDVEAVGAVLAAGRGRHSSAESASEFADALLWASRVPAEIALCAADVAVLAVAATREGKPPMRADAEAAVLLARTAAQAAVTIVAANLAAPALPKHEVQSLREKASAAAERAGIAAEVDAMIRTTGI